ncbi:MAG TPA: hypothetical protein VFH78_15610 [Candidatus Thermoplasmatota archaeon]|nr:hypothetical protein [Candidatus Thermoplasmatota archaeon]
MTDHHAALARAVRAELDGWRRIEQLLEALVPGETPPEDDRLFQLKGTFGPNTWSERAVAERAGYAIMRYGDLEAVRAVLNEPALDVEHLVPLSAAAARAWQEDEPLDPTEACDLDDDPFVSA